MDVIRQDADGQRLLFPVQGYGRRKPKPKPLPSHHHDVDTGVATAAAVVPEVSSHQPSGSPCKVSVAVDKE